MFAGGYPAAGAVCQIFAYIVWLASKVCDGGHELWRYAGCPSGDSDKVVPYEENGAQLYRMYTEANAPIQLILKPGCDHHPHGLEDNTPLIEAVEKSYT